MYINTQTVLNFCDRLSFHTNTIYSLQHSTPSFRKYSIYFHFLSISLAQKLVRCQNLQKCACGKTPKAHTIIRRKSVDICSGKLKYFPNNITVGVVILREEYRYTVYNSCLEVSYNNSLY